MPNFLVFLSSLAKILKIYAYSVLAISKYSPFPLIDIYDVYCHCLKCLEILLLDLQIIFLLFFYLAITHLVGLWSSYVLGICFSYPYRLYTALMDILLMFKVEFIYIKLTVSHFVLNIELALYFASWVIVGVRTAPFPPSPRPPPHSPHLNINTFTCRDCDVCSDLAFR